MPPRVRILGGGPAGSAAALAALGEGAEVAIFEKSVFPRHKVCGEFLSPGIAGALERLGVTCEFLAAGPARVSRVGVDIGRVHKQGLLPEPAYGLSRFALDSLLLSTAALRGATVATEAPAACEIAAGGRPAGAAPRGERLFGFKSHFTGPAGDAVELFFFDGCYVGVSAVENGRTNVCGIAPEDLLRRCGFDFDAMLSSYRPLQERTKPLSRAMGWLASGPLVHGNRLNAGGKTYLAGDALSFVDPFTGSGVLAALLTGMSAGQAAARGDPVEMHIAACREALGRAFHTAAFLRRIIAMGWGEKLAPVVPVEWLYLLTRPKAH